MSLNYYNLSNIGPKNQMTKEGKKQDYVSEEDAWNVVSSYYKNHHLHQLVRHQLESYNYFINYQIQDTIDMFNPVIVHSTNDYNPEFKKYGIEVKIEMCNFKISRPQIHENNGASKIMFPQEARMRNFTYTSQMTVDLNVETIVLEGKKMEKEKKFNTVLRNINIGKIPIMLNSDICVLKQYRHLSPEQTKECKYDPGGYFIVKGSEKTVIAQERAAENKIACFNVSKNNTKWSWKAEIKSIPSEKCISPKQINMMIANKQNSMGNPLYIQIPRIKQPIPVFILFRALGIISDKQICQIIMLKLDDEKQTKMLHFLKASIVDANNHLTKEDAINYIINFAMYTPFNMDQETGERKKREFTQNVLDNDLFPHCRTKQQKIMFLGLMANKLIKTSFGIIKATDRDSYVNKRLDLTGALINNLFRNYFNKLVKDMQKQITKEINVGSWRSINDYNKIINCTNIYKIVKSSSVENGIKKALSTGDFGIKNVQSNKVGVAQVLNRLNYPSTLSHLRRVNTPIDKSGKLIAPRKLHNTQCGFICVFESPEGQPVGVVKNLTYLAHVTIRSDVEIIYDVLKGKYWEIEEMNPTEMYDKVKVFVNGNWIGIVNDPLKLYNYLKHCKSNGRLNCYTGIVFDYHNQEIRICNDAGRIMRPLLKTKNGNLLLTKKICDDIKSGKLEWNDLLINHGESDETCIEYIDPEEQEFSMIAMSPNKLQEEILSSNNGVLQKKYTHCEIHPSTLLGVLASCIPFPHNNQSPRNTYQCAMGKQAMGMYATNHRYRLDKTSYVQTYVMKPLVNTRVMNMIKLHEIPSGTMCTVAIMSYSGYNQEDSIIFNRRALDLGLFSASVYHTERDEDKKIHGDEEIRCRPVKSKTKGMKYANYSKIDQNGVIPKDTHLENKDIILGKVIPIKEHRNDPTKVIKYVDQSKVFRTHEDSYIDMNYIQTNGDGYTFTKTRTRTYRVPVIGDKFASRHGQKGTVGIILENTDMPFTEDGIVPDLIINPHAIPSRMTIGQLKETLMGRVLLDLGMFGDGTCFNELKVIDIQKELRRLGYEENSNQVLYNGMDGTQLNTSIFIGPVYYQRLKHMVKDKCHSRSIGPNVILTRQPSEGRGRDGGLRFGEMERDCMAAYGTIKFLKDRMYDVSDKFHVDVCNRCGMMAIFNNEKHLHRCNYCENFTDFSKVEFPYACKLLFQELMTMNVAPRIITDEFYHKIQNQKISSKSLECREYPESSESSESSEIP